MLRDNKLRPLNPDPCLPMLSEGAANRSDLPTVGIGRLVACDFVTSDGESDIYVVRPIRILSIEVNRPFVRLRFGFVQLAFVFTKSTASAASAS